MARTPKPSTEPAAEPDPIAAPAPLEHAAPNAEIAELGEHDPDLGDGSGAGNGGGSRRRRGGGGGDDSGGGLTPGDEDPAPGASPVPVRHRNGLVAFAQGSWRELQRVQWPDQRQVMQATGVVIGFVIVAGAYLSLADWVANKIVHFILS